MLEKANTASQDHRAIEATGVTRYFGHYLALRGVNLSINQGEFLTIFGPNGAGKTTMLRVLATILRPSSGSVRIGGLDIQDDSSGVRQQIGVVSHQTFLYDELTAYENLRFYGRMYGVPGLDERVRQLLDRVGLTARQHDRTRTFSRGMQQRLSIARALVHDPGILLLDEPETGLDKSANAILMDMAGTFRDGRRTVVMTTHGLERGLEMATRVAIMARGKVVFEAPRDSLDLATLQEAYDRHTGPTTR